MLKKKILVLGDIMIDTYHFGQVNRISPEAPVPVFLKNGEVRNVPGGAANVAMNLAAIGIDTEICSVVGNDVEGEKLMELLEKNSVGHRHIFIDETRRTTQKLRYIGPNNQQMIRIDSEDTFEVSMEKVQEQGELIEQQIEQYGLFLISDYMKGFLSEECTQYFINLARRHDIPVFVDVKDERYKKYYGAMVLKPNRKELGQLSGMEVDSLEKAVDAARSLCIEAGSTYVLATLGAEGMILVGHDGLIKSLKSVAREVFDVTGAGDTSIAYLAAAYIQGKDIEYAMEIANVAAGIQVSKMGTSIVTPEEVEKELKHMNSNIKPMNSRKVVFTNGCFDIIHAGHVSYLKQARALGDKLIVGINSDASVKRLKGEERPINSLVDRMNVLEALACVDEVIPFEEDTPLELIKKVAPDILVKGGDYTEETIVGAGYVKSRGGRVEVIPFLEGHSTTKIVAQIQGGKNE